MFAAFLPLPDVYLVDIVLFHDVEVILEAIREEGVDALDGVEGSHLLACKVDPFSAIKPSVEEALIVGVIGRVYSIAIVVSISELS